MPPVLRKTLFKVLPRSCRSCRALPFCVLPTRPQFVGVRWEQLIVGCAVLGGPIDVRVTTNGSSPTVNGRGRRFCWRVSCSPHASPSLLVNWATLRCGTGCPGKQTTNVGRVDCLAPKKELDPKSMARI